MQGRRSHAQDVRDFTEATSNVVVNQARPMTYAEVSFLIKMVAEECMELLATVSDQPEYRMITLVREAKKPQQPDLTSTVTTIAEQADAMVDIMYFCHNAAAKVGVDCDQVFDVVHAANMAKRFPDGTFHKDSDGKILKPPGWTPPDVPAVVRQWYKKGATWQDRQ